MATASHSTATSFETTANNDESYLKILLPYGLAILAQLPMLFLYFKGMWERPHYQSFPFAITAAVALAALRWPYNNEMPFHRSRTSTLLLVLGLGSAVLGMLFMVPWFAAFSVLMLTTSLLARTYDDETGKNLWTCALPLFVCLMLPNDYDSFVITKLQAYSARFTSQLLDLLALGHHMDGVVITVPGGKQYGVEEACSGVVSFFTLLAITTAFLVWARRITVPHPVTATMLIVAGLFMSLVETAIIGSGWVTLLGIALILMGFVGFRSSMLLMSAVFWALFMNTVRILVIPLADDWAGFDLSHGFAHDILGYIVLIIGGLLVLSTDQFLLFLFGPVETGSETGAAFSTPLTRFWNGFLWGDNTGEESSTRKKRQIRKPITSTGRGLIWTTAGVVLLCGALELWFVKQSLGQQDYKIRFFDTDVTMDFSENDMPETLGGNWKQVRYLNEDRSRGSDLGKRSDIWQFQAPRCTATTSLDQTFPGWHELTTCYKNQGWNLISRQWHSPEVTEGEEAWPYIEARFSKETGEKGYLLFSHFDAFGEPVDAPDKWGSLNSLVIRVLNRLNNRVRATLFDGAVYQTQVWLQSFNELDNDTKAEVRDRYLKAREIMREKFKEKRAAADKPA